ncbi:MAG: aminopeptidase P family N-terminal domain-containing protein, partial [Microlunatus sp.]|nr:aminopeptidase P family N-terminal domain-containing protein [Microlunatus sp.]
MPPRGFSEAEFDARLGRGQDLMAASGVDALLLTTEPEVRYFSGFRTPFWQSPTRPWFLIVPGAGKPVAVIPEIGYQAMAETWVEDIRTWSAPRPADEGVSLVTETIRELVGDRAVVGVPTGPETTLRMPLNDYARLTASLPGVHFGDATQVIKNLRMVKSETEIAKISHVCRVTSAAFAAVPQNVSQGHRLSEVFRSFKIDLLTRGVDDIPYLVGAAAPGGYASVISPPDERPLTHGDVLMLDAGAVWDGYFCDFDRNFALGLASPDVRRGHRTLRRAV